MAIRKYGAAYQGSKSKIADEIISKLPNKKYFIDAFSGGGALAHCALESGKFEQWCIDKSREGYEIFVCEYNIKNPAFEEVWSKEVINCGGGNKNQKRSIEKLYHVK